MDKPKPRICSVYYWLKYCMEARFFKNEEEEEIKYFNTKDKNYIETFLPAYEQKIDSKNNNYQAGPPHALQSLMSNRAPLTVVFLTNR